MNYQLFNDNGTVEAVIDDNCGTAKFYTIANTLSAELNIKFFEKHDKLDGVTWHFRYNGHPLKLHYNVYNGISINATNSKDNEVVNELAEVLRRKYF